MHTEHASLEILFYVLYFIPIPASEQSKSFPVFDCVEFWFREADTLVTVGVQHLFTVLPQRSLRIYVFTRH